MYLPQGIHESAAIPAGLDRPHEGCYSAWEELKVHLMKSDFANSQKPHGSTVAWSPNHQFQLLWRYHQKDSSEQANGTNEFELGHYTTRSAQVKPWLLHLQKKAKVMGDLRLRLNQLRTDSSTSKSEQTKSRKLWRQPVCANLSNCKLFDASTVTPRETPSGDGAQAVMVSWCTQWDGA